MAKLKKLIVNKNIKLITAESCTGGLLSANITNFTLSSRVILNLVISVLVNEKLEPFLCCSRKIGITEPLENITFPYLTTENLMLLLPFMLFLSLIHI